MTTVRWVVTLAVIVGCTSGTEPGPVVIDGEYSLTSCQDLSYNPPQAIQCRGYRPHGSLRIDSARVVLRRDHTARWMMGQTGSYNPCYITGKECFGYDTTSVVGEGTYTVSGDTIFLIPSGATLPGLRTALTATIPSGVTSSWTGPEVISWNGPGTLFDTV